MLTEDLKYRISLDDIFSKGIATAETNAASFEKVVSSLQNKIAGLFAGFQTFNFVKSVIDVGGEFEAAEIGLTTLLKSAQEAKSVITQVKKDAMETPFDVKGLLMGERALISAGLGAKQAREDILNLANAIAATGGGDDELSRMAVNMQQIKNIGKASALDIKQFGYAGINIYTALAEATGKTAAQVKEMDVSYELLTYALKKAHDQGGIYENGLENMSKATKVMVSNMGEMWDSLKNDLFLQNKESIDSVIASITSLIKWLKNNIDSIKNLVITIGLAATAYASFIAYQKIAIWYNGLSTAAIIVNTLATEGWAAAQIALNIAMEANPIGLVIAAVAALTAGVLSLKQQYDDLVKSFDDAKKIGSDIISERLTQQRDALMKQKGMTKELAEAQALASEKRIAQIVLENALINESNKQSTNLLGYPSEEMLEAHRQTLSAKQALKDLYTGGKSLFKDVLKGDPGPAGTDLGSGLNEPKASKIQNITINLGGVFANQKNTFTNSVGEGVDDFMGKLSKALNSVVLDAAVIASE